MYRPGLESGGGFIIFVHVSDAGQIRARNPARDQKQLFHSHRLFFVSYRLGEQSGVQATTSGVGFVRR